MVTVQTNPPVSMLPALSNNVLGLPFLKFPVFAATRTVSRTKIQVSGTKGSLSQFSSMGLVMPFHPCIWGNKAIGTALDNALQMVRAKMKDRYNADCINKTVERLQALFSGLDFNTLQLSIAVLLTPADEKVIYLSFPVKPVVFFSKSVSVLDLAANIKQEADFYLMVLDKKKNNIFEYSHHHCSKVIERRNEKKIGLYKNMDTVFKLLNERYERPVLVTGIANRVAQYCASYGNEIYFPLKYEMPVFTLEGIKKLADEISRNWRYWHSKFVMGRIILAYKANHIISNTESVLKALQNGKDGILVLDKRLKKQIQKPIHGNPVFKITAELLYQVEKFIARGNRIEIMETGLLASWGGMVLIQADKSESTAPKPYNIHAWEGNSIY